MSVLGFLLISQPNLNAGVGERRISPTTAADAAQREVLAAGELTIDLTHLDDSAANAARITVRDTTFDTDIATIPNQRQILLDEQEAQTASPITGISTGMAPVTLSWPRWDLGPPRLDRWIGIRPRIVIARVGHVASIRAGLWALDRLPEPPRSAECPD